MEYINREFKAVVQDTTHVYIGAQMCVRELMIYEDVPFKVKAIFNKFFGEEEQLDTSIAELMGSISKDSFLYQVCKQLRLKFKVGKYIDKRGKKVYKSGSYTLDEFIDIHSTEEEIFDEEIVFNKLALMAFST